MKRRKSLHAGKRIEPPAPAVDDLDETSDALFEDEGIAAPDAIVDLSCEDPLHDWDDESHEVDAWVQEHRGRGELYAA